MGIAACTTSAIRVCHDLSGFEDVLTGFEDAPDGLEDAPDGLDDFSLDSSDDGMKRDTYAYHLATPDVFDDIPDGFDDMLTCSGGVDDMLDGLDSALGGLDDILNGVGDRLDDELDNMLHGSNNGMTRLYHLATPHGFDDVPNGPDDVLVGSGQTDDAQVGLGDST
ncbi:hypothetical protein NM688_g8559 [Phlebia brevispora]|uniref:Uncharacterized protein n=1 Tax=Phlebia brevispora TaxID=194682 RepID=A0ACC1RU51_9APHY|nr:hypothetical protein NM688_g8559 [Phlebia brevispora]